MNRPASLRSLLAPALQPESHKEDGMTKISALALVLVFAAAAEVSAQAPPASTNATVSIRGCVAPVQRDGSLAPKAGTFATPNTAPMEANSPEPTGVFMLLDATPGAKAPTNARTTYALAGHESELAKLNGDRVEIVGSVIPVGAGRAEKGGAGADSIQRIRVASVKRIAGSCSAAKK
jgi:hypothetical protein